MTPPPTIVIDLGYGDSGKGTVVDYLTNRTLPGWHLPHDFDVWNVRFNGGAQAAHNVVFGDGQHHTYSQYGSGTACGAKTYLSAHVLLNPLNLENELRHLRDLGHPPGPVTVSDQCRIITPVQRAANRFREIIRGEGRHGSCGQGIGEVMADWLFDPNLVITANDLVYALRETLQHKMLRLRDFKREQLDAIWNDLPSSEGVRLAKGWFDTTSVEAATDEMSDIMWHSTTRSRPDLNGQSRVIFEGSQGVLLDEWYGFHPYTTWSTTTAANATAVAADHGLQPPHQLGVVRTYMTRHGPGPFVSESAEMTETYGEPHNGTGMFQGEFRCGYFDLVATNYALEVASQVDGGIDGLAVTHMDRLTDRPVVVAYDVDGERIERLPVSPKPDLNFQDVLTDLLTRATPVYEFVPQRSFLDWLEEQTGIPVVLTSSGPTSSDKQERGLWETF